MFTNLWNFGADFLEPANGDSRVSGGDQGRDEFAAADAGGAEAGALQHRGPNRQTDQLAGGAHHRERRPHQTRHVNLKKKSSNIFGLKKKIY